jgi:hypothetical protein
MMNLTNELPTERVECPRCGLRAELSAQVQKFVDPFSKCVHKEGWKRCLDLSADLSEARTLLSAPENRMIRALRAKRLKRFG